ncbi:hypothetical protein THZG08_40242 [Vibrio owensii]|nr:hypothetical protein THZG08_40242 [Vibrio owensii]CAH1577283.1 hypothetical protein THOA03_40242 [Vibrio owensii]
MDRDFKTHASNCYAAPTGRIYIACSPSGVLLSDKVSEQPLLFAIFQKRKNLFLDRFWCSVNTGLAWWLDIIQLRRSYVHRFTDL